MVTSGLIWKVYSGFKKSTKQPAAVFVLEKRALDRFERHDREFLLDLYKKAIAQLTRLRHPQVRCWGVRCSKNTRILDKMNFSGCYTDVSKKSKDRLRDPAL